MLNLDVLYTNTTAELLLWLFESIPAKYYFSKRPLGKAWQTGVNSWMIMMSVRNMDCFHFVAYSNCYHCFQWSGHLMWTGRAAKWTTWPVASLVAASFAVCSRYHISTNHVDITQQCQIHDTPFNLCYWFVFALINPFYTNYDRCRSRPFNPNYDNGRSWQRSFKLVRGEPTSC